ncbi:MAG: cache domain-containing protein, partial [Candidatus Hinthialibacter sp.]
MKVLWNIFRLDVARIVFPSFLVILLFILFLFLYMLPTFEKTILEKKKENERELIQIVSSLLDSYQHRIETGELTPEEGRSRAIRMIRNLRYGTNKTNYFWINDLTPRMIMHPYRPDLEGQNLTSISDPYVKLFFKEIIKALQKSDADHIEYVWRHYEDPSLLLPKISYIRLFKPWNWIIGTGTYRYTIEEEMIQFWRNIALMGVGVLLLLLFLSIWTIRQRLKSETMRENAEAQIQNEKRKLLRIIEFLP